MTYLVNKAQISTQGAWHWSCYSSIFWFMFQALKITLHFTDFISIYFLNHSDYISEKLHYRREGSHAENSCNIIWKLTVEETSFFSIWAIQLFSYLFIIYCEKRQSIYLFKVFLSKANNDLPNFQKNAKHKISVNIIWFLFWDFYIVV